MIRATPEVDSRDERESFKAFEATRDEPYDFEYFTIMKHNAVKME